jgi:hypothetical protein
LTTGSRVSNDGDAIGRNASSHYYSQKQQQQERRSSVGRFRRPLRSKIRILNFYFYKSDPTMKMTGPKLKNKHLGLTFLLVGFVLSFFTIILFMVAPVCIVNEPLPERTNTP